MKKLALLFLACLLILSLMSCTDNGASDDPPDDPSLKTVTVAELGSLKGGEQALLTAVVEGAMGDKIYVSDSTGACELTDISLFLFLRCDVGHLLEFTVEAKSGGVTATDAKLVSRGNETAAPAPLTSLSEIGQHLHKKVAISGLTIVKTEGNIFEAGNDARIVVSDGTSQATLLLSRKLAAADRKAIADALSYPTAGDTVDIKGAFITDDDGTVIELGAKEQFAVKPFAGKINVERIEKDVGELSLDVGEALVYTPKLYPDGANNLSYMTYTVSDPSVAFIDENGAICGKSYGKTYLHIAQTGGNKVIIPIYVEPKLELGYDKWSPSKIDETPRVITNMDELRATLFEAALGGYRQIYIDFNLTEPIREADIDRLFEAKYLGEFALKTVIGGDWVRTYTDELVMFTFSGWEDQVMSGPYEPPTAESGVNFTDAATVLRQKYVIANSPYRRSEAFEDFPIAKNNSGTIPVYNPSQLVWALEYNLLPTFPLENSKAEYIYNQAKEVLRQIITDDMTEIQKCKAIFDYVCQNAVYAVDYYGRPPVDYDPPEQHVIGFFERGRVVCEGYSEVFSLLAGIEGIEVRRIKGDFEAHHLGGHMWNAVHIDGKWYEICVTQSDNTVRGWPDNWFDEETEGRGHDTHSYRHFLVTNEYFKEHFPYQTPSGEEYSAYYDVHLIDKLPGKDFDFIIDTVAELEKVIGEVLALELTGNYYINLAFRGVDPTFEMLEPIMNKYGFKGEYTYSTPIESLNGKDVYHTISFHSAK